MDLPVRVYRDCRYYCKQPQFNLRSYYTMDEIVIAIEEMFEANVSMTSHWMRRTTCARAKRIAAHLSTKRIDNQIPITVNHKKARV